MSKRKPYLSRDFPEPFDFERLLPEDRLSVEREIDFKLADRLAYLRDKLGPDRFVSVGGKSGKQMSRYIKGDAAPVSVIQALADETGVSVTWLANGTLSTDVDVRFEEGMLHAKAGPAMAWVSRLRPEPSWSLAGYKLKVIDDRIAALAVDKGSSASRKRINEDETDPRRLVSLPRYDEVRPSAGAGAVAINESAVTRMSFEHQWLMSLGVEPDSAVVLPAQGDSMEPTIANGTPMVVDMSKQEIRNGYIYVIRVGDDLLVKRVSKRLDGQIELLSDNQAYSSETLRPEDLERLSVIGRVYACITRF